MSFHLPLLVLLLLLTSACTNNNNTSSPIANEPIDNRPTATTTPAQKTPPKATYAKLNASTYAGKVSAYQEKTFLEFISIKQAAYNKAEAGQGNRIDTLYKVSYLPFKDQELYLYQTVLDHARGGSKQWCLTIIKNGEYLIDEHIITTASFDKMEFHKMEIGDTALEFTAIDSDEVEKTFSIPYDGKAIQ
ncbi:hypothetical protein [Aureispira anguillae]|uniref:Lipoprotein n=1 Tax=Aureispira anguillae TaxID=2864201 RepID=A0A915YI01_9BACT|nr:hypothetical protein [Aureispira anguillae]BDS13529.1 hypothetical protein AsAng_0042680 [Aureispira anguillae]